MAKARKPEPRNLVSGSNRTPEPAGVGRLLDDLRRLIDETRQQVARTVNSAMAVLYWQIGKRVREDILHEKRADYGEEIVSSLATQLTAEYGRGFSRQNLFRMIRFAEVFPDEEIVSSLMRQLSWNE